MADSTVIDRYDSARLGIAAMQTLRLSISIAFLGRTSQIITQFRQVMKLHNIGGPIVIIMHTKEPYFQLMAITAGHLRLRR